jgi:YaiO family outer membrane protein
MEDWRDGLAQLAWRPTSRRALLAGGRETERFGQRDREGFAAAYVPLPFAETSLHVEGAWSDTHRVLPRNALLGEIAQPLGGGWVLTAGGRRTRYPSANVSAAWTALEKYVGDLRFAWQAQVSRPEGAAWAPAHRASISWYRGDLTSVSLIAARGREVENLFPAGLLQAEVRSIALTGGVEVAPRWGLTFELSQTRQGDLYSRRGARLGTRVLF